MKIVTKTIVIKLNFSKRLKFYFNNSKVLTSMFVLSDESCSLCTNFEVWTHVLFWSLMENNVVECEVWSIGHIVNKYIILIHILKFKVLSVLLSINFLQEVMFLMCWKTLLCAGSKSFLYIFSLLFHRRVLLEKTTKCDQTRLLRVP